MSVAGGERQPWRRQARERDGNRAVKTCVVAKLARLICPPARHGSARSRASMATSSGYLHGPGHGRDPQRRRPLEHCARAKLARGVHAPAAHSPCPCNRTCVKVSRTNHHRRTKPRHTSSNAARQLAAVAELANTVCPPAGHGTTSQQGAGVALSGADGDRSSRQSAHSPRKAPSHKRPVAELTECVCTPTLHGAVAYYRARVGAARGDTNRSRQAPDWNGTGALLDPAVAQLARVIGAPALQSTDPHQGTRVTPAGADR